MANYVHNTRKYDKWFKEGRGQGQKESYKPWLTVFDVPSEGRSHVSHHSSSSEKLPLFQILKPLGFINLKMIAQSLITTSNILRQLISNYSLLISTYEVSGCL